MSDEPQPSTSSSLLNCIEWADAPMDEDSDAVSLGSIDDVDNSIAEAAGLGDPSFEFVAPLSTLNSGTNAHFSAAGKGQFPLSSTYVAPTVICNSNICAHGLDFAACSKCKGKETIESFLGQNWLLDSGASAHFTFDKSDFVELHDITPIPVKTANGMTSITAEGSVLLNYGSRVYTIAPVFYVPDLNQRLLSLGQFLNEGLTLHSDSQHIHLVTKKGNTFLTFNKRIEKETLYFLPHTQHEVAEIADFAIYHLDYETMHRCFGHPSHEVLRNAQNHTEGFPKINFPTENPICRGCAEGKMPLREFPPQLRRASRPFELIHSDLKEFSVLSYHKYKYAIVFLDDCTSHAWVTLLRTKAAAISATKQFLAMVKTQYKSQVEQWMSDAGGEYTSEAFVKLLKDEGINVLQSAPYTPQQNGHAERFMRTMMDKAQAMRLLACLPDSWWEFAVEHAAHIYNRTPLRRLKWQTPFEAVKGEVPRIDHLRVFGCGAYVHIPANIRKNKLAPKSETMVYLGIAPGGHGNRFMRAPNNVVFTSAHAIFEEAYFPKCEKRPLGSRRLPVTATDEDEERPDNLPPDSIPDDDDDFISRPPHGPSKKGQDNMQRDDARPPSPPPPPPDELPQPRCSE